MALSSMTGFARSHGVSGPYTFEWELKSVNAKGFDFRIRLPQGGWDEVEVHARKHAADALARGTVYANLAVSRRDAGVTVRINEDVLGAILKVAGDLSARIGASPPTVDGLLAIKGVLDVVETETDPQDVATARIAITAGFDDALQGLVDMRRREGATLAGVLALRLDDIAQLCARADAAPGRRAEAIRARLAEQIKTLLDASERFDTDRLSQEAIMIATRADIREELDRIASHVSQARELIAGGGAVGRKLDFLSQEFNREVNTVCSKSNDVELTTIGLEMKTLVEQFREQIQNLE